MDRINLAKLIFSRPEKIGGIVGNCVWCGWETEHGLPLRVSDGFTGYGYFTGGNCMCPACWAFFDDPRLRRKSWVATAAGISYLTREGVREILINPPDPPWYSYLAKAGKKQGWLAAIHKVNYTREHYWISCEWQGAPLWVRLEEVVAWSALIEALREVKVSKGELLSGQFGAKTYERAIIGGYRELLTEARRQARKPLWEVLVYVTK